MDRGLVLALAQHLGDWCIDLQEYPIGARGEFTNLVESAGRVQAAFVRNDLEPGGGVSPGTGTNADALGRPTSSAATVPRIDVHTHLAPRLSGVVNGVEISADDRLIVDGHRVGVAGLYEPDRLASLLARYEIDTAWVSAPPPMYRQGMDVAATGGWVRTLEEGMRARIAGYPSLGLLSYLPFDQPEVALGLVAEIDDSIGWTASAGGGSRPLDDIALGPLWERLEEADKPLLLHPGESPDRRLDSFYLSNLLGNPVETGIAAAQLLLGGVLERHPGLKVIFVHCGGVLPVVVGRWAQGVASARPGIPADTADPRQTVRSVWVDTLAHSPAVIDLALELFGADHLLLGSDYPFPMGVKDPFETVAHLEPELRAAIACNAAGLLAKRGTR